MMAEVIFQNKCNIAFFSNCSRHHYSRPLFYGRKLLNLSPESPRFTTQPISMSAGVGGSRTRTRFPTEESCTSPFAMEGVPPEPGRIAAAIMIYMNLASINLPSSPPSSSSGFAGGASKWGIPPRPPAPTPLPREGRKDRDSGQERCQRRKKKGEREEGRRHFERLLLDRGTTEEDAISGEGG